MLHFYITPFSHLEHVAMKITSAQHSNFGIHYVNDELLQHAYIKDIFPNSYAAKITSSLKAFRRKPRGMFVIAIDHHPVFTSVNVHS